MKQFFLKCTMVVALCICMAGALFATPSFAGTAHAATAAPRPAATCALYAWTFSLGSTWKPGNSNSITTCSGHTLKMIYQDDGNFVLYCNGGAIWATNTNFIGWFAVRTSFQSDGNLVVYSDNGFGQPAVWASNTNGEGALYLILQRDGNLVIYTGSYHALWSTRTNGRC